MAMPRFKPFVLAIIVTGMLGACAILSVPNLMPYTKIEPKVDRVWTDFRAIEAAMHGYFVDV
jgi:hypothetical protein